MAARKTQQSAYPNDEDLYAATGEVLLHAAGALGKRPLRVTTRQFNTFKADAGHPLLPNANQICERLRDQHGNPYRWHDLKVACTTEGRNAAQTDAARTREPAADYQDERHVYYALNRVAQHRQTRRLIPGEYRTGRDDLISHAPSDDHADVLAAVLPTEGQIVRIMESWEAACELAGLDVDVDTKKLRGMPLVELMSIFADHNHCYPSHPTLLKFADACNCALAALPAGTTWATVIDACAKQREADGLPHDLPRPARGQAPPKMILPPNGIPDAAAKPKPRGYWTDDRIIEAIDQWDRNETKNDRSQRTYVDARSARGERKTDWPTISKINKRGGLPKLLEEARRRRKAAA